ELRKQPAPGKWSRKQLLGHLVDSAINNLKRFTDAQIQEQPYTVISYKQNELVALNNYQELPLAHLLQLWQSLNRQIIYVCRLIPEQKLMHPVDPQYEKTGTQTLAWLICDYVAHMQHHVKQMLI
ncbi:MAG: DinB family protein, partial [Chitinophagaceae bacterium]|nr:DinB family protein [Chitinophagaceae bacterium]